MTALSADRPSVDPKDDLFGHAPFAENLASDFELHVLRREWMNIQVVIGYSRRDNFRGRP